MRRRLSRPAPGTVLGVIAVVISLTGSAYAISLGRNDVKSKHIAPNAVKGKDVAESSLKQVPSAADADAVGGHAAACPAATFAHNGFCYDNAPRAPVGYVPAQNSCADAGGFLPTLTMLKSISGVTGIDLGVLANSTGHWTESFEDELPARAVVMADDRSYEAHGIGTAQAYRCVYALVR